MSLKSEETFWTSIVNWKANYLARWSCAAFDSACAGRSQTNIRDTFIDGLRSTRSALQSEGERWSATNKQTNSKHKTNSFTFLCQWLVVLDFSSHFSPSTQLPIAEKNNCSKRITERKRNPPSYSYTSSETERTIGYCRCDWQAPPTLLTPI